MPSSPSLLTLFLNDPSPPRITLGRDEKKAVHITGFQLPGGNTPKLVSWKKETLYHHGITYLHGEESFLGKNFPLAHTHLKGQQNLKQAIEGLENTKAVWKPWHKVWKPDGVKLSLSHSDQVMPLKFWLRKARGALQAAHRHKLCVYLWKKGAN